MTRARKLSESRLWKLQRTYFDREGVVAWSGNTVPHYVTSNPFIAASYAEVISAFLRDARAAGTIDPEQPVHIVELGAGSGRFGFYCIDRLRELHAQSGVRFKYVLTDVPEATLAFWRAHPMLRPLVDEGLLDFARFDAERDTGPTLLESGERLEPGRLRNPLVVVANYVFDGLPQDAFLVRGRKLLENWVYVEDGPAAKKTDPDDPAVLAELTLRYEPHPAPARPYGDPELDAILRGYARRPGAPHVPFPIVALRCCQRLRALASGRLLLLSADKGGLEEVEVRASEPPGYAVHGSFSMSVNYHALAELFRRGGGEVLAGTQPAPHLRVVAFLLGATAIPETRRAFADAVERFGPDEFFSLKQRFVKSLKAQDANQLLAFLRLSRCDPRVLEQALPALIALAPSLSTPQLRALYAVIARAWELYFHLGEEDDFPFGLGMLLFAMDDPGGARRFFEWAEAISGEDVHTAFNRALCHWKEGERGPARACVRRALTLDPAHTGAAALLAALR